MTADEKYKGQDGGLYGAGQNGSPESHPRRCQKRSCQDRAGSTRKAVHPSGTTRHKSRFDQHVECDASIFASSKSSRMPDADKIPRASTIADCAQGGRAMAQWVSPDRPPLRWKPRRRRARPCRSPKQVQIAWVKLADVRPTGELADHTGKLQKDTIAVVQNAKAMFPNLKIVYLGSRIYAGYATTPLNPEPCSPSEVASPVAA